MAKQKEDKSGHVWEPFWTWLACKNCGEIKVPDGPNEECPNVAKPIPNRKGVLIIVDDPYTPEDGP